MILQALVKYYETLLKDGKAVPEGWCSAKVSYALNLSREGTLKSVIPLKQQQERGKKIVWIPNSRTVPKMVARSSGIVANFLCDNSKYILGVDAQGSGKRVKECFEAAKEKHLTLLANIHNDMAEAIKNYFMTWNPEEAKNYPVLADIWEEVIDGSNLIFCMGMKEAQEDLEICKVWNEACATDEKEEKGTCLVTGKQDKIARIHTTIKGVQGAQSSGAALVSFNAPSFESYGKEQSYNAPVGEYAAFAYTTALNTLLSQRKYIFQLGDTTVVFWAESGEETYQKTLCLCAEPSIDNVETIRDIFKNITQNKPIKIDGIELDYNQKFYILGLAPNAARLSVRFFYQNSFGKILENIAAHYSRMEIVKPSWENREFLGVNGILWETINQKSKDKKPVPNMAAAVLRAILSNARYPGSLYTDTLIRIRAEQGKITWGRASIVKAYLIQNFNMEKGEDFVGLNEETNDVAYVTGRIFSVLEAIQEDANPGLNATIKDRYFNSACATPGSIFPILMKLKNSHIRKFNSPGKKIYYEKILTELMGKIGDFPKRLTLEEQGRFMLGYYHQVQKRYEKKEEE